MREQFNVDVYIIRRWGCAWAHARVNGVWIWLRLDNGAADPEARSRYGRLQADVDRARRERKARLAGDRRRAAQRVRDVSYPTEAMMEAIRP